MRSAHARQPRAIGQQQHHSTQLSAAAAAAHVVARSPAPRTPLGRASSSSSSSRRQQQQQLLPARRLVVARNGLGDELLDFIEGGRKMRRWYGQGEKEARPEPPEQGDGGPEAEEEEEEGDGDAVLVTDAEGAIGEQVVLQLILARASIRVLVRDVAATKFAFGSYVSPLSLDLDDAAAVRRALRGVGSVVAVGKLGALPQALAPSGVSHVLLLSTVGAGAQGGLLGGLFQSAEASTLSDPRREEQIQSCGVPYSIVRCPRIKQSPGGLSRIALSQQEAAASSGSPISCEDLAAVLVATLRRPPASGRTFQVRNEGPGQPPDEWAPLFKQLQETSALA